LLVLTRNGQGMLHWLDDYGSLVGKTSLINGVPISIRL
jgi:hypothetical protein